MLAIGVKPGSLRNAIMTTARILIAALLLSVSAAGCSEEEPNGDLRSELAEVRDQIAGAKDKAEQYQDGLIGEMAAMRLESLQLSASLLENRLIAVKGGVPARLVAPATAPDPVRAEQILRHIEAAEAQYDHAKKQAATSEGVAGRLAHTTVVTQELALAQLWLAYYQAAFGLVLPGPKKMGKFSSREAAGDSGAPAPADPHRIFGNPDAPGERPPVEDAKQESAVESPVAKPVPDAAAQEVAVQDLPPPADQATDAGVAPPAPEATREADPQDVTALIENAKRRAADPKKTSTDQQTSSEPKTSDSPTMRAGLKKESKPGSALQPLQWRYGRETIVRIQLLLQEAGHHPGKVDGRWSSSTQRALAEFQRRRGLPASGQPDATTLDALGLY